MSPVRRITYVDQTADIIREGIASGRWRDRLPGLRKMSAEFAVSRQTLRLSLERLVGDGVLRAGGDSEAHSIVSGRVAPSTGPRPLRIAILMMRPIAEEDMGQLRIILELRLRLEADGHHCEIAHIPNDRNPDRIATLARVVANVGADLWLVNIGSADIIGWFHGKRIPILAMGGRHHGFPVPALGYDVSGNIRVIARRLIDSGHERIVLITRRMMRHPVPGKSIGALREELEASGIRTGSYLAPDWEETPEGLETLLDSLFKLTPPTAIVCFGTNITVGVIGHLSRKGLRIPQDVSVVSSGEEAATGWLFPTLDLTHFDCSNEPFLKSARRWVLDYSQGRRDTQKNEYSGPIHEGDSVGPAKR